MNSSALTGDRIRSQVAHDVTGQRECLQPWVADLTPQHRPDTGDAQHDRLELQQGEEQERLVLGHPPGESSFGAGLLDGEGQRGNVDVGVFVLVVGVGVVPVVLVDPPPVADPGHRRVDVSDQIVTPPRGEDLPVPGIMPDEGELGEHHRE